jgi:sarcosine oxidase subunit delta
MMQIVCPFCGSRELREFEFRKTVAQAGASAFADAYLRAENAELSLEHWQHALGCRAWLLLRRNTITGEVLATEMLGTRPT